MHTHKRALFPEQGPQLSPGFCAVPVFYAHIDAKTYVYKDAGGSTGLSVQQSSGHSLGVHGQLGWVGALWATHNEILRLLKITEVSSD